MEDRFGRRIAHAKPASGLELEFAPDDALGVQALVQIIGELDAEGAASHLELRGLEDAVMDLGAHPVPVHTGGLKHVSSGLMVDSERVAVEIMTLVQNPAAQLAESMGRLEQAESPAIPVMLETLPDVARGIVEIKRVHRLVHGVELEGGCMRCGCTPG